MTKRNIILGVCGGIAAYKTPELVRRLRDRDADVQVVMTRSANEFVTGTTLQAVSGRQVRSNLWDREAEAAMGHIELARWADIVVIAPATAEIIARLAAGNAPDLLTTLCLATRAPLVIAPAMNHVMWSHPAVAANVDTLRQRGVKVLGPGFGDQACGETGEGRMLEPDDIAEQLLSAGPAAVTKPAGVLAGRTVMITAGPTREAIDPVRFISNRSSGKMGYALAESARDAGASVILVSGPVALAPPDGVDYVAIESARQLFAAVHERIDDVDIFVAAAAVADYRPTSTNPNKIKKSQAEMRIDLVKAPDTLASVAKIDSGPFTVGFAAETERVAEYAKSKLEQKRLDMIIANKVGADLGFDQDDNAVEVFWPGGEHSFPTRSKSELAGSLIELIAGRFDARPGASVKASLSAVANSD